MGDYKMIYQDQVFNVINVFLTTNGDMKDTGMTKPQFIEATYVDENGELKILRDEAWCFKFIRR